MDRRWGWGLGIGLGAGFLVGAYVGFAVGATHAARALVQAGQVQAGQAMPGEPPSPAKAPGPDPLEIQRHIEAALGAVAADPGNLPAWVALANGYFDSHQPDKAIEAYGKALALDPDNPDLLTDQGTMYRQTGAFAKAVAAFERAQRKHPDHIQSQFNLGVVYGEDLKAPAKAIKAYSRVLELAPSSPQAAEARRAIERLKAR